MNNPATRLQVERAVLDDASSAFDFKKRVAADQTPQVLHTLPLNPEHTDRTVWVCGEAVLGTQNWYFDGELRFWYLNKLQLKFPVQSLQITKPFPGEFAVKFAGYEGSTNTLFAVGAQPALEIILSSGSVPLIIPAIKLKVRADRVELYSMRYQLDPGGIMITGVAVLSCYP